jgi:hypothetical protein
MALLLSCLFSQSNHSSYVAHIYWHWSIAPPHSIAPKFTSIISCTFCGWVRNFYGLQLGSSFRNFVIFFNLVHIFAISKLCSESISSLGTVCTKVVEKYCWAITLIGVAFMLHQIRLHFVGSPISNWPPLYTCTLDHMYIQFRLAQNSTCTAPSGTELIRKSWRVCCSSTFHFIVYWVLQIF